VQKDKHFCIIYRCAQKKRRVHFSLIYRRILIIYTPNEMVVNSLQKALNSHIALRALRIRCQNILFQMRKHIFFNYNSDKDFYSERAFFGIHIHTKKVQKTLHYSLCLIDEPPKVKSLNPISLSLFRLFIKKRKSSK
jgi:hypothetical protein